MKRTLAQITVMLVDDHAMVRDGFRKLLEAEDDVAVVGEAKNGRDAVALARKLRPDVVVMDIAMPILNGLDATGQIHASNPGIKILILSAHSDDAYVERAVALGAVGFLLKQSSSNDLSKAIHEAQSGKTFFSSAVAQRLRNRFCRPALRAVKVAKTANRREREGVRLKTDTGPQKGIAAGVGSAIKKGHQPYRDPLRRVTPAVARSGRSKLG